MNKFLENNTLSLRAPEPEDLEVLYKWENDTDIWQYGTAISPYSKFILKQYIADAQTDIFQSKQLRFMIVLQKTNDVVGTIDLYDFDAINSRCGVGIYIDSEHRQKKLATQALSILQNYAFNFLRINQLYALIPRKNKASLRLFQSSGFSKSGILKQWISTQDTFEDAIIVQKTKSN
ncbi:MAG: GNAT family N-acetyltransferase [Dysgonamonadaceae bacterium]|jgi:diamine N-acetyltransferase|nr:GNAT family N-acetyltransferase [Dysgonamonadaceae bacterium]MDD3355412.1 GNAT family N-acetyltransferase [Dysgonamonadaceae bacterium]MDD3727217.1 GNAT family N-acetyltransferase [Dysgonamonadaceae bacterium]MDD4245992.1 GNAT family N-acetyltransferase [Dysgonamonadaceae bacterium]MDD4605771.1 GNAT family N-acetyltransferase [Dysgonamonadaceae bacterium]